MSPAFPRALRPRFPAYICEPALSIPQKNIWKSFLTHDCPTNVGQESATAGGSERTHLHCVRRPNRARRAPRHPQFPPFQLPPFSATRFACTLPPCRSGEAGRQKQGGAGGIISDLAVSRRTRSPVCTRHTVQAAELVRRRLRLTPEVNSGCLPAVGRAPNVRPVAPKTQYTPPPHF